MVRRSPPFDMVRLFAALADRTRLRLLNLMDGREVCVCYFVGVLDESQPKISRHLAYLRKVGIVRARRDGKWMHYSIQHPRELTSASILDSVLAALRQNEDMQRDLKRLKQACCNPRQFAALQGASAPAITAH